MALPQQQQQQQQQDLAKERKECARCERWRDDLIRSSASLAPCAVAAEALTAAG